MNTALLIENFENFIKEKKSLKLAVTFIKTATSTNKSDDFGEDHHVKRQKAHFHSKALLITNEFEVTQFVNLTIQQITKKISEG